MQSVKKFLFETSFDAHDGCHVGGGRPKRPVPIYTEDDLEAAREAARAEGKAEGLRDAQASIEAIAARALTRIGDQLAEAGPTLNAVLTGLKHGAIQVALTVTRKVLPGLARQSELREIEALVSDCLEKVLDEPRVVVRVPDSLLDALKAHVDTLATRSGFAGRLVLLGDRDMPECDCRVEWADGGVERDSARLWKEIDEAVERFLAALGPGTSSLPPPEAAGAGPTTIADGGGAAADGPAPGGAPNPGSVATEGATPTPGAGTPTPEAAPEEADPGSAEPPDGAAAGEDSEQQPAADSGPETEEPTAAGEAAKTE